MSFKKLAAVMTLLFTLLSGTTALAHDQVVTAARGTIDLNPPTAVADQPVTVTVKPVADDGHPLSGGTFTATFTKAGGEKRTATFTETQPGVYTASVTFSAKDWHAVLRFEQGETKLVADTGFTVFADAGKSFGAVTNRELGWRQAGVTAAPPWTDTATWIIVVVAPVLAALALWRKQGSGDLTRTLAPAREVIPAVLLTIAVIGALAMPFGGYWDISWHHDQGRDGLLSPPHLGIYGGILTVLISLAIGIKASGGVRKIREFPALAFAVGAMLVQLASAPLDELWHRLMGLDISVWAPPHDMLIFGGAFSFIGLAAIQAAADPEGKSLAARLRTMGFGIAALGILNAFLAEFEFDIPAWHVSQSRPAALYPTLLALAAVATLVTVHRLTSARWSATLTVVGFWLFRAAELRWFLPALNRSVPRYPALVLIAAGIVIDLVLQSGWLVGRYRHAAAGAAAAVAMFALYQPLAAVMPVKAVPTMQLLAWSPVAVLVAGATGYIAGWLGDYVLTTAPAARSIHRQGA